MEEKNEDFKFEINRDPKLTPDTDIKIGKDTVKFSYIEENFPINKDIPISILVYWDDVCQYTSIGMIEILNALFQSNAKIDFEHFFERPNDYCYGMDYVYKVFEKTIPRQTIDKVKKQKYWQLLEISVKSAVFASLSRVSSFINKIGFYFPYRFVNCDSLRLGLNKFFYNDSNPNGVQFHYGTDSSFNSLLKTHNYNSIITPNILSTYQYILDNDLKKISIIGPEDHNKLDDDMKELLSKMSGRPKPNYCSLNLYKEQLFV